VGDIFGAVHELRVRQCERALDLAILQVCVQAGTVSQPAHRFVVHLTEQNHTIRASHFGFEQRSVHQSLAQAFAARARVDHDGYFRVVANVGQLQQTNELRMRIERP
jgi:hypothetical protein